MDWGGGSSGSGLPNTLSPTCSLSVTGHLMETPGLGLPGVRWLGIQLPVQGTQLQSPARGDHRPRGNEGSVCHNSQSLSSRSLRFAMRRPHTATREQPLLVATRESPHVAKKIQRSPLPPKDAQ